MGAPVAIVACVGDDAAGRAALATLREARVGVSGCRVVTAPTGRAAVLVDRRGENAIVAGAGANACLDADDARAGWPPSATVLLAQCEIPATAVGAGLALAHARGVRTVVNATPAEHLDALGAVPDVLIVNRLEAGQLGAGEGSAAQLATALARRRGIATVVVTDGGAGAAAAIDGGMGEPVSVAAPAVEVVDTTGAGDAFAGVLVASLAEDVELPEALRRACRAGALACLQPGAVPSLPMRAAVLAGD
jgi:ribokinase